MHIFLEEEPGHCPKIALLLFDSPLWSLQHFPSLISNCLNIWNSGKVKEAKAYSLKTRNGGHRKACAQEFHRALFSFKVIDEHTYINASGPQGVGL